jgi:hypothetical protein
MKVKPDSMPGRATKAICPEAGGSGHGGADRGTTLAALEFGWVTVLKIYSL